MGRKYQFALVQSSNSQNIHFIKRISELKFSRYEGAGFGAECHGNFFQEAECVTSRELQDHTKCSAGLHSFSHLKILDNQGIFSPRHRPLHSKDKCSVIFHGPRNQITDGQSIDYRARFFQKTQGRIMQLETSKDLALVQ